LPYKQLLGVQMKKNSKFLLFVVLLFFALVQGCNAQTAIEIETWIKQEIPLGSTKTFVVSKLEEKKIEHSANYKPELYYNKSKSFNASIPNTKKGVLTKGGIYMKFNFNEKDELVSFKVEEIFTGL